MAWKQDHSAEMTARRRKAFKRGVQAMHGRRREVSDAALASRNAYRRAIGLPEVTAK